MPKLSRNFAMGGRVYIMMDGKGKICIPIIHFPNKVACKHKMTYSVDRDGNNKKLYITLDEKQPLTRRGFRYIIPMQIQHVLDLTEGDIFECRETDKGFELEYSETMNELRHKGE